MKLYHGTSSRNLNRILKFGLKPRGQSKGNWDHTVLSHPDAVYMTSAYAVYFAMQAAKEKEDGLVVEIDTNQVNPFALAPDEDFLAQVTTKDPAYAHVHEGKTLIESTKWFRDHLKEFAGPPNWQTSIRGMGNCCYFGVVPSYAITRYVVIPRKHPTYRFCDPTISILNYMVMEKYYRGLMARLFKESFEVSNDEESFFRLPPVEKFDDLQVINVHS